MYTTTRSFLMMTAHKNLKLNDVDIKTIILHEENLGEKVYVAQPKGCVKAGKENRVFKLNKAVLQLKISSQVMESEKSVSHQKSIISNRLLPVHVSSSKL